MTCSIKKVGCYYLVAPFALLVACNQSDDAGTTAFLPGGGGYTGNGTFGLGGDVAPFTGTGGASGSAGTAWVAGNGGTVVPDGSGGGPVGSGGASGSADTSGNGGSAGSDAVGAGSGGTTGGTGGAGGSVVQNQVPLVRADGFGDASPPPGQPLPDAPVGQWTWVDLETTCRDGSSSGLFVRYSDASPNYFVYLEGGGVCLNDFFCGLNPMNINQTLNAESIIGGVTGRLAIPQVPGNEGIFKKDPRNPVADWNAVYVPYCTGDVWGGTRHDATFPPGYEGLGGHTAGTHQFVGFETTSVVVGRVVATFPDADLNLICGSSAGGMGALLNAHRMADLMRNQGLQSRGYVISDSATPFADTYLAPCTQKIWRDLWGLDGAFPSDCDGCFQADGGGIATGLSDYFLRKFPDNTQVLGGLISSVDDEVIKLFYGTALPGCTPTTYGLGTYQSALEDFRDNIIGRDRFATYFLRGTLHMHLWRPRFYETNGTSMSIADWLTRVLNNEAVHVSP
jgi:hypothetical protein